jgi:tetratricopeptide (TPR) repeat protein
MNEPDRTAPLPGSQPLNLTPAPSDTTPFGVTGWTAGDGATMAGGPGPGQLGPCPSGLGRYQIKDRLGSGGMGEVFTAFDPVLERNVALKLLHPQLSTLSDVILREARAQASIDHPHVVKVFEAGELEGRPFLSMQLVTGPPLQDLAPKLEVAERVQLLVQACYGVQAAHLRGLLHRDLKPANILVETGEDGRRHAFVSDFGLARATSGDLSASGVVMGTPAFMSPEQIRSLPLDARADVYALGVCLFTLLTEAMPFAGATVPKLLRAVLEKPPISPRALRPELPEDLAAICLRCLAKDREDRYVSAKNLAEDLERWLSGRPVLAMPQTLLYRGRRWVGRSPRTAMLVGLLVLAMATAAGLLTAGLVRGRVQTRYALHFNQEVEELELALAAIHHAPPGTGAAQPRLLAELWTIERELAASGRVAAGPGHAALGRAWIAFGDLDRAEAHYRQALARGFRTPEVHLGLGTVLAARFQQSQRNIYWLDPAIQPLLHKASRRSLADGSLEQLRQARFPAPPIEVRARLLLGEGRYHETTALLGAALAGQPWRLDIRKLYCDALMAAYIEGPALPPGEAPGPTFEAVMAALRDGLLWAQGDPFFPLTEGELRVVRAQLPGADPTAIAQEAPAILACGTKALAANPGSIRARILMARVHLNLAMRLDNQSLDANPEIQATDRLCREVLAMSPGDADAHAILLSLAIDRLNDWPFPPKAPDPGPLVVEALEHLRQARAAAPEFAPAFACQGAAMQANYAAWIMRTGKPDQSYPWIQRGLATVAETVQAYPDWVRGYEIRAFLEQTAFRVLEDDPAKAEAFLKEAVKDREHCVQLAPNRHNSYWNCSSVYLYLAIFRMDDQGQDPTPEALKAADLCRKAEALDPSNDSVPMYRIWADTIRIVYHLATGQAGLDEVLAHQKVVLGLRPPLRSMFMVKTWNQLALAQHLRGEDPSRAMAETRKAADQAQADPGALATERSDLAVLMARNSAASRHTLGPEIRAARNQLSNQPSREGGLDGEVRLLLIEARWDPARRDQTLAQARARVADLEKSWPHSRQTQLLKWGVEAEDAALRGRPVAAEAQAGLRQLAQPGSCQRLEAELFLAGRWR